MDPELIRLMEKVKELKQHVQIQHNVDHNQVIRSIGMQLTGLGLTANDELLPAKPKQQERSEPEPTNDGFRYLDLD